jgi:hypothetical protein
VTATPNTALDWQLRELHAVRHAFWYCLMAMPPTAQP